MRALAFAAIAAAFCAGSALAHDHWINNGNYVSTEGVHCCGDNDCFELAAGDVRETAGGYLIVKLNEVVPFSEAQISEDGHFWRCRGADGKRRCFFAPPSGA
jgi:hypothetical protein